MANPSQYISSYPSNLPFKEEYRKFIEEFYLITDTPDAHNLYAAQFATDARLVMASREANGANDILAMRKSLWEKVSSRSHKPLKIFPFGADSDEVMIYGTVEYEFKAGGKGGLEWAARGTMGVGEEGKVVWKEYIVYLDTAAQKAK